jgi:hypothetical protein
MCEQCSYVTNLMKLFGDKVLPTLWYCRYKGLQNGTYELNLIDSIDCPLESYAG